MALEIPNFDMTGIINLIKSLLGGLSSTVYSIASMIWPDNPTLVIIVGAIVIAYMIKDKVSGLTLFAIIAVLVYLILTGGVGI